MAYVGTARRLGTDRDTLASIIAGEASGEGLLGMRAVASVIQNRARQNFSGYGSSFVAQATARRQFQGQAAPTAQSYQVADELLSGSLNDVTGGALYYANPGASTARWARRLDSSNALRIGNHYFTDNTDGTPFTGTVTSAGAGAGLGEDGTAGDASAGSGDPSKYAWAGADTGTFVADPNSKDVPEAIDEQTKQQSISANQEAAAISAAAQTQATTQAATTQASLTSVGGWLAQAQSWATDKFIRAFVVILGLVLIGGAIALLVFRGRDVTAVIEKAASGVAGG